VGNRHSNSLLISMRDGDGNLLHASLFSSNSSIAMKLFQKYVSNLISQMNQ
jgi:hypothetical protein